MGAKQTTLSVGMTGMEALRGNPVSLALLMDPEAVSFFNSTFLKLNKIDTENMSA
jgi:hypothetical protein